LCRCAPHAVSVCKVNTGLLCEADFVIMVLIAAYFVDHGLLRRQRLPDSQPKSTDSLAVQITGPLIRIIGDRFASGVKAAILGTMSALLGKAGPALKPFLPQLQTTFLKCLTDPVRGR
jgi:hypothetical protein